MDFGEICTMVVDRTKRPDKLTEIRSGVNAAIAFFASANFPHDRVELTFPINSTQFVQSFDITASPFLRYKVMDYIRPTGYRKYLNWRDPKKIFQNGCENLDVYYRSGNNIVFKLSMLQSTLELGYFQFHDLYDDDTDTDWMFDQLTEAIVLHARGKVMRDIGEDGEANNNIKEAMFLWEAFKGQAAEVQA